MVVPYIATIVVASVVSLLLTSGVRRLARRYNFVDKPDRRRKTQSNAIALGGGVAVLEAAILAAVVGVGLLSAGWPEGVGIHVDPAEGWALGGLAIAASILCIVGLIDDRFGMRGGYKLLWQVIACSLIIGTGLTVNSIVLLGLRIPLDMLGLGYLFTLLWLLGAINSLNLIDGIDGLASGVGVIFSFTFGLMAVQMGSYADAAIAFALGGALLGFLRFNFPPASIYLGDAGSMVIGLVLGTLALRSNLKEAATLAFAAPLVVWAIPLLDSVMALMRRKLTGRSFFSTDRGHIHHRLLTRGFSTPQALGVIMGLCAITAGGALASIYLQNEAIGVVTASIVFLTLVASRVFGHSELLLLNKRLLGFGKNLVTFSGGDTARDRQTSVRLQGSLQWEKLWEGLVESAERFQLISIRLNLYLPRLHEDFYATWKRESDRNKDETWRTDVPLLHDGVNVGRLSVVGVSSDAGALADIGELLDFVDSLEGQVCRLLDAPHPSQTAPAQPVKTAPDSETPHPVAAPAVAVNGSDSSGSDPSGNDSSLSNPSASDPSPSDHSKYASAVTGRAT